MLPGWSTGKSFGCVSTPVDWAVARAKIGNEVIAGIFTAIKTRRA